MRFEVFNIIPKIRYLGVFEFWQTRQILIFCFFVTNKIFFPLQCLYLDCPFKLQNFSFNWIRFFETFSEGIYRKTKNLKKHLRFIQKRQKNLLWKLLSSINNAQRVENVHRKQNSSLKHKKDIILNWDDKFKTLKTIESGNNLLSKV